MSEVETIFDFAKKLTYSFKSLQRQPVCDVTGAPIGIHCNAISSTEQILGGGTAANFEQAKRIAVAEFIERNLFFRICGDFKLRTKFWIDDDPSTSGFSVGFDRQQCRFRSIAESLERWAWTKWIDDGYEIPQIVPPKQTKLGLGLGSHFERVEFRRIRLSYKSHFISEPLYMNVLLGFFGDGIFPGSRVSSEQDDGWTHSAVEAWRNLRNFQIYSKRVDEPMGKDQWVLDRLMFFGRNASTATKRIDGCHNLQWPEANLREPVELDTGHPSVYMWRSLCSDYVAWKEGGTSRFMF